MGSKGQSDLDVSMDVEASTPSDIEADFEDNDAMDAEDDVENDVEVLEDDFNPNEDAKMSEDSDGGSDLSFHRPNNKKRKVLVDLLSSDEELEAPFTAVVGGVAKKAVRVTSSVSLFHKHLLLLIFV
jgi:23S rRNA A2030 N6-methylase RlmJ